MSYWNCHRDAEDHAARALTRLCQEQGATPTAGQVVQTHHIVFSRTDYLDEHGAPQQMTSWASPGCALTKPEQEQIVEQALFHVLQRTGEE